MRKIFLTIFLAILTLSLGYGSTVFKYMDTIMGASVVRAQDQPFQYEGSGGGSSGGDQPFQYESRDGSTGGSGRDGSTGGSGRDGSTGGTGRDGSTGGSGIQAPTFDIQLTNPLKGYTTLCQVLEAILRLITELGAIVAVIFIILSGFKFITAQGNMTKLNDAKHSFYTALLGTAILLGASVIAQIVVKTVFSITNKTNTDVCSI